MHIAFDIIHPAHVHFFAPTIKDFISTGHTVRVFSRHKELVCELLDDYGIHHQTLSTARTGVAGLLFEMIVHQGGILKNIIWDKPDVITALGGPLCTHISRFRRCPVAIFTDTHIAKIQNAITLPFASKIFIPDCYPGPFYYMDKKFITYPGYHELAYLHPNRFKPDKNIKQKLGVPENGSFSILRFTAWESSHDFTVEGLSIDQKRQIVKSLLSRGKVFISSEKPLEGELAEYQYPLPGSTMHHALASASMVVGESATMVSEAVVLGTPGIFISPIPRCYTDEQDVKYKMARTFRSDQFTEILDTIKLWSTPESIISMDMQHKLLLTDKIDVTNFIKEVLTQMATNSL
ncbi:MAG: DUF354 domain-containing protein [Candidatus Marinimicrobia bacterium]|jgi:hypothetical protein|nr:DUF354 domain-containing protein [Candidatus Neomarinimicrobiota bacterium]MBT3936715.1 DUF354 domain-containing protein [Candidatus Neomarinimicrobiota bacterium]MBT3960568.1 DUF354 domain-containing protein [Candidatus Neomarinimicrobiota bacterium]MBT4382505.1 DUF354 domain-containing protein [Candidatus Neomarinimicrobiota bacterium]MBT4637024.1 DUF354 domain-containing protein [Candidatus Neomarinimicrobiota bacterium]